jgi:hypothetical protein
VSSDRRTGMKAWTMAHDGASQALNRASAGDPRRRVVAGMNTVDPSPGLLVRALHPYGVGGVTGARACLPCTPFSAHFEEV